VWAERPARILLLAAGGFALALLAAVSLVIPAHAQVFLGFTPEGLPRDLVPSVRLYLLPVLNGLIFTANLFLGLFFFRQVESRPLAYILWAASAIVPLLFLIGVFAILRYLPA
jgi:hypothetical protein